jgi:haloacetate dehalogenase
MSDLFPGFSVEQRVADGVRINVCHNVGTGERPPLLLLHGFPQTHAIWHKVAPHLATHYTLVMPDLRGYGDSDKPVGPADHSSYSKRTMAADQAELMRGFGFDAFFVCGHDRGARVAHRLALDHPRSVRKLMLLDISPTLTMYERTTMAFANLYYHWFFLIQPAPLPEKLIGADPVFYLHRKLSVWGGAMEFFDPRAIAEYERCFNDSAAIHAMCEDYRAAATIDLEHDRADALRRIECPVRILWGEYGVVHRLFRPLEDWQAKARLPVSGRTTPSGHYIPEQTPELLQDEMLGFFK